MELKSGDFVVRTSGVNAGRFAVFLGIDENNNYVVKYAGNTSPAFVATKQPESTFRVITEAEMVVALLSGKLELQLSDLPKNQHYRQIAAVVKEREEKFSPLVVTSEISADEAKGFLPG